MSPINYYFKANNVNSILYLYCISLGPQPVGVQCLFTSSLGEFLDYWSGSGILGCRLCWCPSTFPLFAFHISVFFLLLFFICHWISFVFLLYDRHTCTHSIDPSLADGKFPGLGLALVPDVVVPEAEHGWSRNLVSNFCPGRGLNLGPHTLKAVNVTTQLRLTPVNSIRIINVFFTK